MHTREGINFFGPGATPAYAAINFLTHYDLTRRFQLAVQVDNIFDHHYYSAAQLVNTSAVRSATLFTPGAPRRAWVELRIKF